MNLTNNHSRTLGFTKNKWLQEERSTELFFRLREREKMKHRNPNQNESIILSPHPFSFIVLIWWVSSNLHSANQSKPAMYESRDPLNAQDKVTVWNRAQLSPDGVQASWSESSGSWASGFGLLLGSRLGLICKWNGLTQITTYILVDCIVRFLN